MTVQDLEQELLKLSPGEKLRIVQLLLQSLSSLWDAIIPSPKALPIPPTPVAILNRLATLNPSTITDPLTWQRDQRHDRSLPGRDDS